MVFISHFFTNKAEETYNEIFGTLLSLEPKFNPTDFTIDFEMATLNAVKRNFPLSEVHGCFFHFSQNIWRHIQNVGLQNVYNNDEDFALNLRYLIALAFVPVDNVENAYEELVSTEFYSEPNEHKDKIESLLDYFQSTYVYAFDRLGKRKAPLFPVELWNVFEETLHGKKFIYVLNFLELFLYLLFFNSFLSFQELPRTNNHCEGFHNRINGMWGAHPNIYRFINELKSEQDLKELEIAQIEAGREPAARKRVYVSTDKKLMSLVKKFNDDIHDGSFMPYLKSIAHNARF